MKTFDSGFLLMDEPLDRAVESRSLISRYIREAPDFAEIEASIARGELDPNDAFARLIAEINRGVTSGMTAFPVRENLDGEVHILTPVATPLRNRLPRTPGAGKATAWKVQSSFGVGLGTQTTTSGTTNSANTLVVANANGFFAGETILYASNTHTISSVDYTNKIITVGASPGVGANSQTNGQAVVKNSLFFPESGTADQIFYSESGSPSERTTVYADLSASYKLLGTKGSITMFAAAAGRNFMDQYAVEKRNTLTTLLLKEEFALLFSKSDVTTAPWGDGTTALGYLGLIPWIDANAPASQIQTSVGALTFKHMQEQLTRVWYNGGRGLYAMMSGQEANSMMRLVESSGNYRIVLGDQGALKVGGKVATMIHATSGEAVELFVHTMMPTGTMVFGADRNAEGQTTAEVEALEQATMPGSVDQAGQSAPFGGYYAQDLAPASATPEKMEFIAKIYSVPKWKNSKVFAISRGLTAVS